MNVIRLGKWTLGLLDALALVSLYATGEIRFEIGMMVLAIFLARTIQLRISSLKVMVGLVFSIIAIAVFIATKFRVFPILMAAHTGAIVHALLWLGRDAVRDRVLRLSMGFVNLSLASALTADFYLFGSIFLFAILGSVYVSLGFLESTFRARVPEQLEQPLPPGYLGNMFSVSLAVFVISVLMFPIIPRTSWKRDEGSSYFNVGYNDSVDMLSAAQATLKQSSRVALRIFSQNPEILSDPKQAIPLGMLKGQALDLFDGVRWLPRRRQPRKEVKIQASSSFFDHAQFEVIREPHVKTIEFLPYHSKVVEKGKDGGRSRYVYRIEPSIRDEAPDTSDLAVPEKVQSTALEELSKQIMGDGRNNSHKARMLLEFFKKGFTGSLVSTQRERNPRNVLEHFLFQGRSGNCELFAGSAAVLLRLSRVPARVVAGYRLGREMGVGGQLTVLDNDAHAWVEYWNETQGWAPIDPTPRYLATVGWKDSLQQMYWAVEGAWYRWLVDFRKDEALQPEEGAVTPVSLAEDDGWSSRWKNWGVSIFKSRDSWLLSIALGLVVFLALRLALGFLSPAEVRALFARDLSWRRRRLFFEYLRFQRLARRVSRRPTKRQESMAELRKRWDTLYTQVRFGRSEVSTFDESLKTLAGIRRELRNSPRR